MVAGCRAYRAVDETDQEFMGSKLVVSFANPAKHYDTHAIRPQTNFTPNNSNPATSKLAGQASANAAGHMLAQRTALLAGKPGFGGRINPSQAFAAGRDLCATHPQHLIRGCSQLTLLLHRF